MAMTPEARVKGIIKSWLDAVGAAWCCPIGSAYGASNMCDFIACVKTPRGAAYVEIEAKATAKDKLTKRQLDKLARITALGGVAWRVDNDTIEDFKDNLATLVGEPRDTIEHRVHIQRKAARTSRDGVRQSLLAKARSQG